MCIFVKYFMYNARIVNCKTPQLNIFYYKRKFKIILNLANEANILLQINSETNLNI